MKKDRIIIWGTGKNEKNIRESFHDMFSNIDIICYIDNDEKKQHQLYNGYKVLAPQEAVELEYDKILILSTFFHEIEEQLINELSVAREKIDDYKYFTKIRILNRYMTSSNREIQKVVQHIDQNRLEVFNYDFIEHYNNFNVEVAFDERIEMFYVIHHNHRMYFSKLFTKTNQVKWYYKSIMLEQDIASPHRYLFDDFNVNEGDVVIDAGVAEGNFALDVIDRVSKIYLIESDLYWIEALKSTFANYMNKVVIINKRLSDYDGNETICLDSITSDKVNFVKIDIEGCEVEALTKMQHLVENSTDLRIASCCYHNDYDEKLILETMREYGLQTSVLNKYMWYPIGTSQNCYNPKLRHGIVQGWKKKI